MLPHVWVRDAIVPALKAGDKSTGDFLERTLEGQVAIITGSVRRLGKAMAMALARDGASVVINARSSQAEAEKAAAEVRAAGGGKVLVQIADVTDEAAVNKMV